MVRRKIANDNSCAFNALGYTLYRDRDGSALRGKVANAIRGNPDEFNEVGLKLLLHFVFPPTAADSVKVQKMHTVHA